MARSFVRDRKNNTTSDSGSSGGGSGGGSSERMVGVDPKTGESDPNSTYRVPESQVKKSGSSGLGGSGSSGDLRAESYKQIAKDNASKLDGKVSIKEDNVIKSDVKGVNQVAIRGNASNNVERTQVIKVAIDQEAVNKFNEESGTAKQYFDRTLNSNPQPQTLNQEKQELNKVPVSNFYAPRTANLSETESSIPFNQNYNSQEKPLSVYDLQKEKSWYATTEGQIKSLEDSKIKTITYLENRPAGIFLEPVILGVNVLGGFVKGGVGIVQFGQGLYETPIAEKPNYVLTGTIEGGSDFVEKAVDNVLTGNKRGIAEQYGELLAFDIVTKTASKTVKGAFVEYGKEIKFSEAIGTPKDANFKFELPNPNDAKTFLTPPEYTEVFGSVTKQQQAVAKVPEGITAVELTPSFYLEASKDLALKGELNNKPPELQAKLSLQEKPKVSQEVSSLTPEEILKINQKPTKQTEMTDFKALDGGSAILEFLKNERATDNLKDKYAYAKGRIIDKESIRTIEAPKSSSSLIMIYKDVSVKSPPISVMRQVNNTRSNNIIINRVAPDSLTNIRFNSLQGSNIIQSQGIIQKQSQITSQATTQEQATEQVTKQTTSQIQKINLTPSIVENFKPQNIYSPPKNTSKSGDSNSFEVFVRKKGKFIAVGVERASDKAFETGKRAVQNSASASFKVVDTKGNIVSPSNYDNSNFYESRKERGVVVQKRSNRINTSGEKAEITSKGIFSQRNIKKNKRGVSIWGL